MGERVRVDMLFGLKAWGKTEEEALDELKAELSGCKDIAGYEEPKFRGNGRRDGEDGSYWFDVRCFGYGEDEWGVLERVTDDFDSDFDCVSEYK